ncbi:MAG TPA: hypothetical protein VF796_08940 [Humisphaera sp.]
MQQTARARRTTRPIVAAAARAAVEFLEDRRLFSAGDLDPGFSSDGKVLTPIGQTFDLAQAQAVQSDGKILIAGSSGGNVAVARFTANGAPDPTFGPDADGRVTYDLGSSSDVAYGIGVDSTGRIYVSGNGTTGTVLRLNTSGYLDTSFSGDGKATIPGAFITGLAVQADNKVVVTGDAPGASFDMMLARFTTAGNLDTTFGGGDGIATKSFTASGYEIATSVAFASDGYIAVGGTVDTTADGAGYDFALWMTTPSGNNYAATTVDASGSGKTDFGTAIAKGPGDTFYLAGQSFTGTGQSDMSVVKFNPFGVKDTTFGGGDGIATVSFTNDKAEGASALAVTSGDSIYLAGNDGNGNFGVARLNPSGTLDTSFDGDGRKSIAMGSTSGKATGIARLSTTKIVVTGTGGTATGGSDFAATRLNLDGSTDGSFGSAGKAFVDFDTADDFASDAVVGSDNKAIVVGTHLVTGNAPFGQGDFAVVRYTSGGALDTAFSGDGRLTTDFGGDDRATGVVRQSDGKIVVSGFTSPGPGLAVKFAVARYNANGTLDTSFSGDGKQTISFGASVDAYAWDMRLQADGKIVIVGGYNGGGGNNGFAVARLKTNGDLDTTFSGDGVQTVSFGSNPAATARGVTIQGDGKIVIAGWAGFDAALARLTTNGSLDNTFSGDGKLTEDLGGSPDYYFAVDTDSNGKIVVGGSSGFNSVVARYNANGTLDTSFNGTGKKIGSAGRILDLKVQTNNKIVTAGSNQAGSGDRFRLTRFNANGTLDTSFSGDGLVDTQFTGSNPTAASALAFGPGGKFVVAGYAQVSYGNQDFAVARYSLA